MKTKICTLIFLAAVLSAALSISSAAWVTSKDDKVYIKDQTGEKWDVTQAVSLGFVPQRFQYGIGKDTFTPLQDEDFSDDRPSQFSRKRVIGIAMEDEAHAYAVQRLRFHEIANTTIGGTPIAAGY